jgi:dienelactone hydrolase
MTAHEIATCDEFPVVADVYEPAGDGPANRAVIMCHGFKGHRRWGFIPTLAQRLAGVGIAAMAMDFSHNGRTPDGEAGFIAPDRFAANTIARERADLDAVTSWAREGGGGSIAADARLGLWGHSRGGVAAILAALDDPSIPAIATWSTAAHPDFYTDRQKERWRTDGGYRFTDNETGTPLELGLEYLDDIEGHRDEYGLAQRVEHLRAAHLIVHGDHDLVIPVEDAVSLYETPTMRADKKLLRLLTGHTFGYETKVVGEALERALATTLEWFDEYLSTPESGAS